MIDGVLSALRDVYDPELDESLVDLQFVDDVRVQDGQVEVVLRLPTFWCAPNFA
jgi:metal-sulfur cluster biosynthetic enzyme